tara:strand:+ start:531 stop:1478 length:948 start_codon:yes stop_codon:yes gene_type:complete
MLSKLKLYLRIIIDSIRILLLKEEIGKKKYIYLKEFFLWNLFKLNKVILKKFKYQYEITINKIGEVILNENNVKISINRNNLQLLHRNSPDNLFYSDILIKNLKFFETKNNLNIKNIIDLGSNIGTMTFNLARAYPNSKIVSIEGSQDNFNVLKKNYEIQQINLENVFIENLIIGPKNKEIYFSEGMGEKSQIVSKDIKNFDTISRMKKNKIYKNIVGLEDVISKYNIDSIDFLKVDIEGSEIYLFNSIFEIKPKVLVMEYNFQKIDLKDQLIFFKRLTELNYEFFEEKLLNKIDNIEEFLLKNKKVDIWIAKKN